MSIFINSTQLDILENHALENFVTELVTHCDKNYGYLRKAMGYSQLREVIKLSIIKAEQSGFTQRGTVRFYLDMLIIFGWEFESDSQYSWTFDSMQNHRTEKETATDLFNQANKYLNEICSESSVSMLKRIEQLENTKIRDLQISTESFIQEMLLTLENIYPIKYQLAKKEQLILLIKNGIAKSKNQYQFTDPNHIALIVILMFLLGHEFDYDPFHSWASLDRYIKNTTDSRFYNKKYIIAKKIESRAKVWLSSSIKNSEI